MSSMCIVFLCFTVIQGVLSGKCITPNGESAECIPIRNCTLLINAVLSLQQSVFEFVKESQCGQDNDGPLLCCGSSTSRISLKTTLTPASTPITISSSPPASVPPQTPSLTQKILTSATISEKIRLLPSRRYCGYQHFDDYLHLGSSNVTSINEFPWLALLIFKSVLSRPGTCVGTLINNKYVLTAANCFFQRYEKLYLVRLGEYNVEKTYDCVKSEVEEECSDKFFDFGFEKVITHPDFSETTLQHDIALIRLNESVTYSDYIRPICLPLSGTKFAKVGEKFSSSGWGSSHYNELDLVAVKKKIFSELLPLERCIEEYKSEESVVITYKQICTLDNRNVSEVSCDGDSGGPLMFSNNRYQWHIEGIISYGRLCGVLSPSVNTNITSYLGWILENIQK